MRLSIKDIQNNCILVTSASRVNCSFLLVEEDFTTLKITPITKYTYGIIYVLMLH